MQDPTKQSSLPPAHPAPPSAARTTRRSFLGSVGRKAAYVTPVMLSLAARQASAGSPFHSTCGDEGSPCTSDLDCCTGFYCMMGPERCWSL